MNTESRPTQIRVSDVISLSLIGGVFVLGVLTYDLLPAVLVIHYTPPGGVYYGLETLPKPVGLFALPVITAVTFGVTRGLPLIGNVSEELGSARQYYHYGILLLIVFLATVQIGLVLLNLL